MNQSVNSHEFREITESLLAIGGSHSSLESNPGMKEQVIRLISLLRCAMYPHIFGSAEDHTAIAVEYKLHQAHKKSYQP